MSIVAENKPCAWNDLWAYQSGFGRSYAPIFSRAAGIVGERSVAEYGFGHLRFARIIGRERWEGYDWSEVAVDKARAEGFDAEVRDCSAAEPAEVVCAFNVMSYLESPHSFLSRLRCPAVLSDRRWAARHLRTPGAFQQFLWRYWKHASVETVKVSRSEYFLASVF